MIRDSINVTRSFNIAGGFIVWKQVTYHFEHDTVYVIQENLSNETIIVYYDNRIRSRLPLNWTMI